MIIEKKILSIFRALEALPKTAPGPEGYRNTKKRLDQINTLLTSDDKSVMAGVVKSMVLLTAGNQETLRDPSKFDANEIKDTYAMMMNTKMYNVVDMLKLPIELMKKPTQEDYILAKKLLPIMGSTSIVKKDIDTHVGKLSDLDRRFKSEGYDTVYRGLHKLELNTISYLMDEPTWDMKRGVSTSYDRNEAGRFAKLDIGYASKGGPAVMFEISNVSKRGFHADTLSRYFREKEIILSGDIKVSEKWELQALGKMMPADPMEGEDEIKINFDSDTGIAIFNWDTSRGRDRKKQNIKTQMFPNREALRSFAQDAIINESGLIEVNGEDWEFEIYPFSILLKVKATLP